MTTHTTHTTDPIAAARDAGREFAAELNAAPHEAQNWSPLTANDDLPVEDYRTLCCEYGDVTPEMDRAYRDGFNSVFGV